VIIKFYDDPLPDVTKAMLHLQVIIVLILKIDGSFSIIYITFSESITGHFSPS